MSESRNNGLNKLIYSESTPSYVVDGETYLKWFTVYIKNKPTQTLLFDLVAPYFVSPFTNFDSCLHLWGPRTFRGCHFGESHKERRVGH